MSKLLVELYFEQRSTGGDSNFRKFLRELMENSDDLVPEPLDIDAKYNQKMDGEKVNAYPYHVLTLTYEVGEESLFRVKKKILESIKLVESKIELTGFDLIKTKTE